MKYSVDRIENDVAVLEGLEDRKIINVNVRFLPVKVKECDILVFKDGKYVLDDEEKERRLKVIKEKMERLRKN